METKVKSANLEVEARGLRESNFQLLLQTINATESSSEEIRDMHIC
jgi:hypothetical protein